MQARTQAHIALFVVALIYGLNYIIAKEVMNGYIGPRGFIFLRVVGASFLFWVFHAFSRSKVKIDRKDWLRILLSGFFGVAANQMLFFEGLNLTTPINASVIMTSNPILVLLISAILLKEPIRKGRLMGILLGGAGAVYLILGKGSVHLLESDTSLGNLFVFINATSYAIYLVVVKPLMSRYPPIQVIKWVFFSGMLFVIPLGANQFFAVDWSMWTPSIYAQAAFVVIGTTFFAYLLNVFALKTVSSTTVSIYIYLQPLLATIAALALGKDVLTTRVVIAAVLIFTGVYLVSFSKR
jgi:drug/metabolite transporter (DMT)-like permease